MKRHIIHTFITSFLLAIFATTAYASTKPRLVVNIVVSSMRANDLSRYEKNFSQNGFRRLMSGGQWFTNASYDYMQTTTPVSLATLSTGAMPSTHGIVADRWFDYVTNNVVMIIDDKKEQSLNYSSGSGNYSPRNLTTQTLSDALKEYDSNSRVATIAVDPLSAIVMAGHSGDVYWMETVQSAWTTSTYYAKELPKWIETYNRELTNLNHIEKRWTPIFAYDKYVNTQVNVMEGIQSKINKRIDFITDNDLDIKAHVSKEFEALTHTPAANSAMLAFAKQLIAKNEMGADEVPDMLNIVLDSPRMICRRYGPESLEYEDMLYRLDRDLADFITFLHAQVKDPQQVVITLSSDHGTSPSYNPPGKENERFNVRQAEVITNAFIGSQHGNGDWVLGYVNRAIYLNHNLIYSKGLSIEDIQHDVATFVMQLRGVSHAITAEAMRKSYFGSGYGRKIQNGFYPRRSGDIIVNLMPGWIEERDNVRSSAGSMYRYDTQVPLIIYGGGVKGIRRDDNVDMTSMATTLAALMDINAPSAAEGEDLTIIY